MWLIHQLAPDNKAYNLPLAMRLRGQLDREALSGAIDEIRRRHEPLRTTYILDGAHPVQIVAAWTSEPLNTVDLSKFGETAWDEAIRLAHDHAAVTFDWSNLHRFRCILYRLGDEDHLLLLTMHHIAIDDWGQSVLRNELAATYNSFRAGRPVALAPLTITYRDYAVWQRRWLAGETDRQLAYWRKQLEGIKPLDLLTDHPRPEVFGFKGNLVDSSVARFAGQQAGGTGASYWRHAVHGDVRRVRHFAASIEWSERHHGCCSNRQPNALGCGAPGRNFR